MRRVSRRSSSLVAQEDREEQALTGENNSKKRTTAELAQSDEIENAKRARRKGSKSNSEIGDFIVVSSRPGRNHLDLAHEQARSSIFSPYLASSPSQTSTLNAGQESTSSNLNETENRSTPNYRETGKSPTLGGSERETLNTLEPGSARSENTGQNLLSQDKRDGEGPGSDPLLKNTVEQEHLSSCTFNDSCDHNNAPESTPLLVDERHMESTSNSPGLLARSQIISQIGDSAKTPEPLMGVKASRTPLPTEKVDVDLTARRAPTVPLGSSLEVVRSPKGSPYRSGRSGSIVTEVAPQDARATESLKSGEILSQHPSITSIRTEQRQENALIEHPISISIENLAATATSSIQMTESSTSAEIGPTHTPLQDASHFNTFAPKFQVHTRDSVQQQQNSSDRTWNRKKSISEETQILVPSCGGSYKDTHHASTTKEPLGGTQATSASSIHSVAISSDHGRLLLEPESQKSPANIISPPIVTSSASIMDSLASISPKTSMSQVQSPTQTFCPPAVKFTVDNRAESILPSGEVSALFASLSNNASVFITSTSLSRPAAVQHPIGVVMWQALPDFYSWYSNTTGPRISWPLKFELLDVHWQFRKSFILPFNELNYFRALKQYIWDLYWVANNVNRAVMPFRISIANYGEDTEILSSSNPQLERLTWNYESANYQSRDHASEGHRLPKYPPHNSKFNAPTDTENIHMPGQIQERSATSSAINTLPPLLPRSSLKLIGGSPTMTSIGQSAQSSSDGVNWYSHRMPRQGSVHSPSEHISAPQLQVSQPTPELGAERVRTESDRLALRRKALQLLPHDMELLPEESSVFDKFPYKSGTQVSGAIIDKMSNKGFVSITGKGYATLNVWTGPNEAGDRYQRVSIHHKQSCMLHGGAVVLYYKRRGASEPATKPRSRSSDMKTPSPDDPLPARATSLYRDVMTEDTSIHNEKSSIANPAGALSTEIPERVSTSIEHPTEVDIVIRIQIEKSGKFSAPYDKSFLRPSISVAEFFSWFASTSGHANLPAALKFTFKDAMPAPTSTQISRGNEDHFKYMRRDIKAQCAKSKAFMPELKEFVVLITVPGWEETSIEEDW